RIDWLRSCGPKRPEGERPGEPARGIMRDLNGRHAALWLTPTPDWLMEAFSTNPEDRRKRLEAQLVEQARQEAQQHAEVGAERPSPPEAPWPGASTLGPLPAQTAAPWPGLTEPAPADQSDTASDGAADWVSSPGSGIGPAWPAPPEVSDRSVTEPG